MTEGEKKTNKITKRECLMIATLISGLGLAFLFALILLGAMNAAEAGARLENGVIVHRGGEPSGKATLALEYHAGITVVRGSSDYQVAPVEQDYKPAVTPARQYFNEYDAWRKRQTHRRLHPRP